MAEQHSGSVLRETIKTFLGANTPEKTAERYRDKIEKINNLEPAYERLTDQELLEKTNEFKLRVSNSIGNTDGLTETELKKREQKALDEILPEAFAAVREASKRSIGLRHFDVQLMGGIAIHEGNVSEMRTGEGKTLVATLPSYLNALLGKGVHVVTVNDYLARRDAQLVGHIFEALGMQVGVLQSGALTNNAKEAYIVDYKEKHGDEQNNNFKIVWRRDAYYADITYGTNTEFGFDYLRDNLATSKESQVQRGFQFAIVDEVDNVLIDQARTPLVISGPMADSLDEYVSIDKVVKQLKPNEVEIDKKENTVHLTENGLRHVEKILGAKLWDSGKPEEITPEEARKLGYLEQSLRANYLFRENKDYLVQGEEIVIIDELTGRLMPGRRWGDGLHSAVEAKESVTVNPESETYATISIQNYFRKYKKMGGMSGTAITSAEEFMKVYNLDIVPIPTNEKDLRIDEHDLVFKTKDAKMRAILTDTLVRHVTGQPILLGTTTVDNSHELSQFLDSKHVAAVLQILIVRDEWFKQHNLEDDGHIVPALQSMNIPTEKLIKSSVINKVATKLGFSPSLKNPKNIDRVMKILNIKDEQRARLMAIIENGIPHKVLNAENHTEESEIIAGAGVYGAVTVATNMAGRGVDIKLGGELPDNVFYGVNQVLQKAGYKDVFTLKPRNQYLILRSMGPHAYGNHTKDIQLFMQHFEDHQYVAKLGGLHVIGSERHEARRIDNQLRGRSARQGDPGSSQFYNSLQDNIMPVGGSATVNRVMEQLKVDPSFPMDSKAVDKAINDIQQSVEVRNYELRKHLLEYDDVLENQRQQIEREKARVFDKQDLSKDIRDLTIEEIEAHAPIDEIKSGELRTLTIWLNRLHPAMQEKRGAKIVHPYTNQLLLNELNVPDKQFRSAIKNLIKKVFLADPNREDMHELYRIYLDVGKELNKVKGPLTDITKLKLLNHAANVTKDGVSHPRLDYSYYLGHVLGNIPWEEQKENIANHLEEVLNTQTRRWGQREMTMTGGKTVDPKDPDPVGTLGKKITDESIKEIFSLTIAREWTGYLRSLEGLRMSIGLESYSNRDPLTAYKIAASDMFRDFRDDIRSRVVNSIFALTPPPMPALVKPQKASK